MVLVETATISFSCRAGITVPWHEQSISYFFLQRYLEKASEANNMSNRSEGEKPSEMSTSNWAKATQGHPPLLFSMAPSRSMALNKEKPLHQGDHNLKHDTVRNHNVEEDNRDEWSSARNRSYTRQTAGLIKTEESY